MAGIIDDLKIKFKQGDLLVKLIFINILVFVAVNLGRIVFHLFNLGSFVPVDYLALPSLPSEILMKPWTLLSYMFLHVEFFHILFNMLVLYWFGKMFLMYFNERNLVGLYIMGGIAGALVYVLAFNFIPYYISLQPTSILLGASASVMAIVFGIAFYQPELKVNLLFVGSVKLIYIALGMFVLDFISLDTSNAGGHVAHIGGALIGYLFARQMLRGRDVTQWLNSVVDFIVNLFKSSSTKKPKMKVKYKRNESDYEYNERKHKTEANIDKILDKLKESGYDSLSADEKKRLFDASKK